MHTITFSKQAAKSLKAMPSNLSKTIYEKINGLAADPYAAQNVKKLEGGDCYRLRVGDWRVLFEINNGELVILVLAVSPRGAAYK